MEHVVASKPGDPVPEAVQLGRANRVALGGSGREVRAAIDLNDKPSIAACEVCDVVSDRVLTDEFQAR